MTNTIDKLHNLDIDLKNKTTGQHTFICPKCSHERKKKNDPCLSVNIDEGIYNCHHCGWHGKVFEEDESSYAVPEYNNTELNDKALNWLVETRGLSKSTIQRFRLFSEGREIGFPFIENDKVVHIKYRSGDKHFRSSKGTKLTLFGMHLDHKDRLIITEGELDAMSFYEAGHLAVSVPNGATSHTWLDNCNEWVDRFGEIILAFDNDSKGIEGRNEIARRIGKEKCKIFQYPEGIKDANELLYTIKHDPQWKAIFSAHFDFLQLFPLDGIFSVDDLRTKVFELRKTGYPKGKLTGYKNLDNLVSWVPGQFTIITGIPSHGKSEFTDQLLVQLRNMKWLIFSPENMPYESHISKLIEKALRKPFFNLTDSELSSSLDFMNDYFTFCDLEKIKSVDDIISIAKQVILQKGITGILIDPYSRIEHTYIGKLTETEYVRTILNELGSLSKNLGVHIILIAHPTKMQKDDNDEFKVPNLYSISGSAHFFNAADVGITVYRRPKEGFDMTEIHVQKVRFKWVGHPGMVEFNWTKETGIYTEA